MAVSASDIKFYYTGGATNSNGNASLGGLVSSVEAVNGTNGLFDDVGGYESLAGDTEYRCLAVKNTNATDDFTAVRAYVFAQTDGDDSIEIAVEKPVSGHVQQIADESTAPAGLTFASPSDRSSGLACTSQTATSDVIKHGEWVGIWIKRVVPAGARAFDNNGYTIRVDGDSGSSAPPPP